MELFDVITDLRGVGPKKAAALKKLNIHTLEDLLFFFPRSRINTATEENSGCECS